MLLEVKAKWLWCLTQTVKEKKKILGALCGWFNSQMRCDVMMPKQHSSEIKHCCVEVKKQKNKRDIEWPKQNTWSHYCRSSRRTIVLDRSLKKGGTGDGGPNRDITAECSWSICSWVWSPASPLSIKAGSSHESGPLMRTRLCADWGHSTAGVGNSSPRIQAWFCLLPGRKCLWWRQCLPVG